MSVKFDANKSTVGASTPLRTMTTDFGPEVEITPFQHMRNDKMVKK